MVDKMGHLDQSADPTDPSMMSHKQMPGVAIVIFLREQMGDADDKDDENAPKSDVIPVKKTGLNLDSIKNKVFTSSKGKGWSLVFQYGSPYWNWGNTDNKYQDGSLMPKIAYFEDYKFDIETFTFSA